MPQRKPYKEYYTASEVKRKLGVTDGMLYNYVRYGHLERITPPGRKQGVYRRDEVDKFAMEMKAFLSGGEEARRFTFTRVSKSDVPEIVKLSGSIFGWTPGTAIRTAWIEKNPDTMYQLCLDTTPIGCAAMLPLKPEKIEQVLRDEVSSERTAAEDIEAFTPGKAYHLYFMGAGIDPVFSKQEKRIYGGKLVRGLCDVILDLGKRGIEIRTITARSETVDGIRLLRHLGFRQIPSVTRKVNFIIDINESDMPLVQQYREEFAKAKQQPSTEKDEYNISLKHQLKPIKAHKADSHEAKAYIKTDSKTEREPAKMVDTSRQNGTNPKSPSRSRSRPSELLDNSEQ